VYFVHIVVVAVTGKLRECKTAVVFFGCNFDSVATVTLTFNDCVSVMKQAIKLM